MDMCRIHNVEQCRCLFWKCRRRRRHRAVAPIMLMRKLWAHTSETNFEFFFFSSSIKRETVENLIDDDERDETIVAGSFVNAHDDYYWKEAGTNLVFFEKIFSHVFCIRYKINLFNFETRADAKTHLYSFITATHIILHIHTFAWKQILLIVPQMRYI